MCLWPFHDLFPIHSCPRLNPGGYSAFSIGLNAFIADISRPDQRAFRMGMINLAHSLEKASGGSARSLSPQNRY